MAPKAKVPVKSGDTLSSIAKANKTTVAAILADPRNATIASRVEAGTTPIFSGSSVAIPVKAASTGGTVDTTTAAGVAAASGFTPSTGTSTMFTGPIPTGATRTETGYIDAAGENVTPSTGKMVVSRVDNGDGTFTVTYFDGTSSIEGTKTTGKKALRTYFSGTGSARIQITEYDDGTKDTIPAPEAAAGLGAEDVNKLIQAAIANQNAEFQKMLAAQQKQLETAKAEAIATQRKSAFDVIREKFTAMGIKEVGDDIAAIFAGKGTDRFGKVFDEIPTTSEGFYLQLINTKSYYDRFGSVNEARLKQGYKALDEKTIVGMEDEYQKVLTQYNMPTGFYDQTTDFQSFLKNNLTNVDVANVIQAYREQILLFVNNLKIIMVLVMQPLLHT
jgi:hypothetical protein